MQLQCQGQMSPAVTAGLLSLSTECCDIIRVSPVIQIKILKLIFNHKSSSLIDQICHLAVIGQLNRCQISPYITVRLNTCL